MNKRSSVGVAIVAIAVAIATANIYQVRHHHHYNAPVRSGLQTEMSAVQALVISQIGAEKARLQALVDQGQPLTLANITSLFANIPIPAQLQSLFTTISIVKSAIKQGPQGFKDSFSLAGKTKVAGTEVDVSASFMVQDDNSLGVSLQLELPDGWKLSSVITSLQGTFDAGVSDGSLIISTLDYNDEKYGALVKGLNFFADVKLSELQLPSILSSVSGYLNTALSAVKIRGHMAQNIKDSSFDVTIPPEAFKIKEITVADIVSFAQVELPAVLEGKLKNIGIRSPQISFDLGTTKSLTLSGISSFEGSEVDAGLELSYDAATQKKQGFLKLSMPDGWRLSQALPEITGIFDAGVSKAAVVLSSVDKQDDELGAIQAGLNLFADVKLSDLQLPSVFNTVKDYIGGKFASELKLEAHIKKNSKDSTFRVSVPEEALGNRKISLTDFINPDDLGLPTGIADKLKQVQIGTKLGFDFAGTTKSAWIKGQTSFEGSDVDIEIKIGLGADGKPEVFAALGMPDGWQLTQMFPQLAGKFDVGVNDASLIIANADINDPELGLISKGLSFMADVKLDDLQLPSVFNMVAHLVRDLVGEVKLSGQIKKNIKESTFALQIPSESLNTQSLSLRDAGLFDSTSILIPQSWQDKFADYSLQRPTIALSFGQTNSLRIHGEATIASNVVDGVFELAESEQGATQTFLSFELPQGWKFDSAFPSLKDKFDFEINDPMIVLSNYAFYDKDRDVFVKKGFNVNGSVNLLTMGKTGSALDKITTALHDFDEELRFEGVIGVPIVDSSLKVSLRRISDEARTVPLSSIFPVDKLNLPSVVSRLFDNVAFTQPQFELDLSQEVKDISLSGGVQIFGKEVDATFLSHEIKDADGKPLVGESLTFSLPDDWKLSSLANGAKALDAIGLVEPKIILSDIGYDDSALNTSIQQGFNLVAGVNLASLSPNIKWFIEKIITKSNQERAALNKTLIFDVGTVLFKADAGEGGIDFSLVMPFHLGFDLTNVSAGSDLDGIKDVITKMVTDDFIASLQISDEGLDAKISTGVDVDFTKRPGKTYTFRSEVDINAAKGTVAYTGSLDGVFDNAFGLEWLSLGDFALAFGMSIEDFLPSEFGFRGTMDLGEGENKAELKLTSDVRQGGILFQGEADNINLGHLLWLFAKMAKKDVQESEIPGFKINKMATGIATDSIEFAGKEYYRGFSADLDIELFGLKGAMAMSVDLHGITGSGGLTGIDKPYFMFTGTGPDKEYGTDDDGPYIKLNIARSVPEFFVSGKIGIPAVKLEEDIELSLSKAGFTGLMETELFGIFDSKINVVADTDDLINSDISFELKQTALDKIGQKLPEKLKKFRANAEKEIANYDADVARMQKEMALADQALGDEFDKRIKKTDYLISQLQAKRKSLKTECASAKWYEKAYICPKVGAQLIGVDTRIAGLLAYKADVKASKLATKTVATGLAEVPDALKEIVDMKQVAQGVVNAIDKLGNLTATALSQTLNIHSASGDLNIADLKEGKLPKMTLDVTLLGKRHELEVQIDVKDIGKSIEHIASQIICKIKGDCETDS